MSPKTEQRPTPGDYGRNVGAFINARRRHLGLSYRKLAESVADHVRGKKRAASENYLYRLCQGETKLRPEVVDGIARALQLKDDEHKYLLHIAGKNLDDNSEPPTAQLKGLLQLLRSDRKVDETAKTWAQTLIDPVVIAVYTLLGRARPNGKQTARQIAKAATSKRASTPKVREALQRLQSLGAVAVDESGRALRQNADQDDIAIHADDHLPNGYKSDAMKILYAELDRWGIDALNTTPPEQRYFQSQTFLVDRDRIGDLNDALKQKWEQTKQQLRSEYESADGDVVVHLGVRAWPMIDFDQGSD